MAWWTSPNKVHDPVGGVVDQSQQVHDPVGGVADQAKQTTHRSYDRGGSKKIYKVHQPVSGVAEFTHDRTTIVTQ